MVVLVLVSVLHQVDLELNCKLWYQKGCLGAISKSEIRPLRKFEKLTATAAAAAAAAVVFFFFSIGFPAGPLFGRRSRGVWAATGDQHGHRGRFPQLRFGGWRKFFGERELGTGAPSREECVVKWSTDQGKQLMNTLANLPRIATSTPDANLYPLIHALPLPLPITPIPTLPLIPSLPLIPTPDPCSNPNFCPTPGLPVAFP